jgi:glycosyltransferase involved in cell wall biosynthesis
MKLSIIIPVYNEEHVIEKCLNSLSNQKYKDLEIIVVDDGSTDNTVQAVENFIQNNSISTALLKQNHKGAGAARNLGAQKAKGEILIFIDADMTFDKIFLNKLVSPIKNNKSKGTFSKDEHVSNWNNVWSKCWNWNQGLTGKKRLPDDYPDKQKVFRAILKKEFIKAGGFAPGGYTDDYSLAQKLGYQAANAPGARFYHENPSTLKEVFHQSKWAAKRKYKLGLIGTVVALVRNSLPISLVVGIYKSILHKTPKFLIFKLTYDLAAIIGIISFIITKNGQK